MKNWRPVLALATVAVLSHYGFLLVRSMREWSLQRENQLLRRELLAVGAIERDMASLRSLARKMNQHLGAPPRALVGDESSAPLPVVVASPREASPLPLSPPVQGRLSRHFESQTWPKGLEHPGMDVATVSGQLVFAAAGGRVVFRDLTRRLGYLVLVDHGQGLVTGYGHLASALPEIGERVQRGQAIGRVGRGGVGRGSHLHFSVQQNGLPLDPVGLLASW